MRCEGLHCDGCGGGGGLVLVVIVALAIIGAIVHTIWRQLVEVVEVVALVLVSAAGLAVLAGGVYLAVRIRARMTSPGPSTQPPMPARVVRLGEPPIVTDSAIGRAIEAPRQHTAGWPLAGRWEQIKPSNDRESNS